MKKITLALVLGLVACGLASSVYADALVAAAPVAAPVVSAPTPEINSVEGTISSLDVTSAAPWLKIKDAAAKEWTIMIDPATSTVWKGGNKVTWADIKVNDKVKVRQTDKDGKAIAKTVEVV